jgi:hypothetical protein
MRHAEFKQFISGVNPAEGQSSVVKSHRLLGCLFLFVLQIVVLLVWGALFFVLGLVVQYNELPALVQGLLAKLY